MNNTPNSLHHISNLELDSFGQRQLVYKIDLSVNQRKVISERCHWMYNTLSIVDVGYCPRPLTPLPFQTTGRLHTEFVVLQMLAIMTTPSHPIHLPYPFPPPAPIPVLVPGKVTHAGYHTESSPFACSAVSRQQHRYLWRAEQQSRIPVQLIGFCY